MLFAWLFTESILNVFLSLALLIATTEQTRSHPELVGNMSRVTLNFDL